MGIVEQSEAIYKKWYWLILIFSMVITFTVDALYIATGVNFYPQGLGTFNWGTKTLQDAVNTLQKGLSINVLVVLPQIIISIGLILVQVLINALLLINWLISKGLELIFLLVVLSPETSTTLASILAWIFEAPIIIGVVSDLGKIIYNLLPLKG